MIKFKVGPIQKPKLPNPYVIMRSHANSMKVGEFFEIVGISGKSDVLNVRSTLAYFSKKDGFKVKTKVFGSKMTVEKIAN
jgi:hypothetical protein